MIREAMALAAFLLAASPVRAQTTPAHQRVEQALRAQGGKDALRGIRDVRLHAMVHRNALEQSVRPEGPWFENFGDEVQVRRLDAGALRIEACNRGFAASWWGDKPDWSSTTSLVTRGGAFVQRDEGLVPARQAEVELAEESLALGPERALLTALAAPDLAIGPAVNFHGYQAASVGFRWRGAPVRLLLQPGSHMPLGIEIVRPRPLDLFLDPWGDVTTRIEWGGWTVEPNGVRYPRSWSLAINGQVERTVMIDRVEFNPSLDEAAFAISAELADKARAARRPVAAIAFSAAKAIEVVPGITVMPGPWYVAEVRTAEGVWVVEGPISNAYSAGVIAHVAQRGGKLLGVITTSDSWPHIGGLREYVARGVPVTALDLNRPILERLFASPHDQQPDALARRPVRAKIGTVTRPLTLGTGDNAMRLIPIRTVTGERQMAIYWPAHRLLYTSDILSPSSRGIWLPQYRDEVASLIAREGLDVETVFGMHYSPIKWAEVLALKGVAP